MSEDSRQAGAECEVTPAMIEAGFEVFSGYYPDSADEEIDFGMIERIWVAMCRTKARQSGALGG